MHLLRFAFLLAALPLVALAAHGQPASSFPSDVPNAYVQLLRPITMSTPLMSPPVSSRAYGYMGLALYESVVHGIPERSSLVGVLPHLPVLPVPQPGEEFHWPTAANHAVCLVLDSLFFNMAPADRVALYALRDDFDEAHGLEIPYALLVRSAAFGQGIAMGILDMARTDDGHQAQLNTFPTDYEPPVGPQYWEPFLGQSAMLPYWGGKRPFLTENLGPGVLPPGPPPFSTIPGSVCYEAALEVYEITTNITVPQQTTAYYWNDGTITPPYHSLCMLEFILREQESDLAFAAVAYATLGISLADAFVSCWLTKYDHNWIRPQTYINNHIDPDWTTWIATPPFPEYTSGHSTQGGAWLGVMEHLFGQEYAFIDSTHRQLHGGPRAYTSFAEAAAEISMSRIYGGIHYRYSNEEGKEQGAAVAANVIDLFDLVTAVEEANSEPGLVVQVDAAAGYFRLAGAVPEERFFVYDAMGRMVTELIGPGPHALGGRAPGILFIGRPGQRAMRLPVY